MRSWLGKNRETVVEIKSVLLVRVSSTVDKDVEHPQFFDPCYPLKYIQAGLQSHPGVTVQVIDCWVRPMGFRRLTEHAHRLQPDLVVVSASSFDVHIADRFAADLKQMTRPPIIIGIGQGYYCNNGVGCHDHRDYDAILLGEPEEAFFSLFERMLRDNHDNRRDWVDYYRAQYLKGHQFLVTAPDELAFPPYTQEELEAYRSIFPVRLPLRVTWGYTIGMRGCPHDCVFCSEVMRVSVGKKLRRRSARNVADEFEHMARQGVNIVSFQDDSFSAHRGFVQAVCEELIARHSKMPWMARARVDELDFELLQLMRRAGCLMLGIGVESGSQRIIDALQKTRKPQPWADLCRQMFRWTRQLGIGTNAYYVIGNPTETAEEIEQTIRLALELNSDSIQVHFYTPYPGSKAWEQVKHRISEADTREMFHYAVPKFTLSEVPVDQLVKLRSSFYRRYIFRPGFAFQHLRAHWRFYRHNPDIFKTLLGIRKVFWGRRRDNSHESPQAAQPERFCLKPNQRGNAI